MDGKMHGMDDPMAEPAADFTVELGESAAVVWQATVWQAR